MALVNGHLPRLVVAGFALLVAATAMAATPDEQYERREAAMKQAGGGLKALSAAAKAGTVTDEAKAAAHAVEAFAQGLPDLFPAGEPSEKSRALPAIWSDPDGWKEKINAFRAAAAGLVSAADGGDAAALAAAVEATGPACGGCHKAFRGPEK